MSNSTKTRDIEEMMANKDLETRKKIPSTLAAPCFSTARDVFTYRRMRIKSRKAEMVIFIKRILPKIDYRY
uniref:Uncharacterized protein n=1 Tax=Meloidogyne hapla TaxID=6305 RepID=A0A1I8B199_MELHA